MTRVRLLILVAGTFASAGGGFSAGRWLVPSPSGAESGGSPIVARTGGRAPESGIAGAALERARSLTAQGLYAEAENALKEAMKAEPGDARLPCQLARLMVTQFAEEPARAAVARALAIDPDGPAVLQTQAIVLIEFHRFQEAEEALAKLRRLVPADPLTLYSSGVTRLYRGDYPEAEADLERVIADPQHGSSALYELGVCLLREERHAEAAGRFLDLLEEDPCHLKATFQLSAALRKLDRPEALREVEAHFRFLEQGEPHFEKAANLTALGALTEAAIALGRGYRARGQYREAEASLRPAAARSALAARELADILLITERRREGLEVLRSAGIGEQGARPTAAPPSVSGLGWPEASPALLAWAQEAAIAGRRAEAHRRLHLAALADPEHREAWRLWADALKGSGRQVLRLWALRRLSALGDVEAEAERRRVRAELGGP